ncbi:MAG: hypothetical protein HS108_15660 [Planctomycetes bacterium]|jgi:hypothetical protein|nr:hypothetical protein [Planctomycetota bacterium]MCL4731791.1 hypothetical protein [Planctomycetota bacterium]
MSDVALRALCLLLLALPVTPAAARESNFGRVILANCDVIVQAVASAKRTRVGDLTRVECSVEQTLHGKEPGKDIQVFFADPALLKKDEAVRALFALKALSSGGFTLVGRPVLTPDGDSEERDKLRVLRAFLQLEAEPEGPERTAAFWALLQGHVRDGGYPAQNAAVELLFVARDRCGIVTEELFEATARAVADASRVLTKQTREDLVLALQGMVEGRIKGLKFRKVRREDKAADRLAAASELLTLHERYPRAFGLPDAELCDALAKTEKDPGVARKLEDLARAVRTSDALYQAEQQRKADETRRKLERATR